VKIQGSRKKIVETRLELGEKLLRHRQGVVGFLVFLIILVMLVFNLGSWFFLNRMGDNLDDELGARLRSISGITANLIESRFGAAAKDQLGFYYFELKQILNQVKAENQLQSIFLINEDFSVIANDDLELALPGEKRTYVQEDSVCLKSAWNGVAMDSPLHVVEGNPFKSAYAPVINDELEIMAILVVEANADFFRTLLFFRRGLIFGGVVSLVVLGFMAGFLYWAISLLLKSYEKMRRSERLALMGQMAASMAHEIRNPLGIMKGTADVLKELYDNPSQPNELFEFIPSEIKRLNRLVTDFLTFARGVTLEKRRENLTGVLEQVRSDLQREPFEKPVQIELELPGTFPATEFDADAIYRVVYNLALNGIQAMDRGGALKLVLSEFSRRGEEFLRVAVTDTGCGISGEVNKIFDPFFTTKTKGTGLGLAISRQIIEAHGGWIEVESKVNLGTCLTFYLPVN
jgi:signal transduction histidine kinase